MKIELRFVQRAVVRVLLASCLYGALGSTACTGPEPVRKSLVYVSPRLRPSDVLVNLQTAYKQRNIVEYAKLLADDFTFCFAPKTRPDGLPPCWERAADSTATARLFAARDISDVRIALTYSPDVPVGEPGKEKWRRIRVTDTFLEADKVPPAGEVITYRVDGDVQDFYLRKGRNPADTLATSPTAQEWFLVGWNDLARLASAAAPTGAGPRPAVQNATWGLIKWLYAQ